MGGPGGAIGATFIFISIVLTPLLGTTLTLATLIAGQLTAALVIDYDGLFGGTVACRRSASWVWHSYCSELR